MEEEYVDPGYSQPVYPPTMIPDQLTSESSLRFQLSSEPVIESIKYTLLGYKLVFNKTKEEEEWVKDENNPGLINQKGMNYLSVVLRSMLDKQFKLTSLPEDVIQKITTEVGDTVDESIQEHYEEWDIKSISSAATISRIITNQVYATLMAAANGEYLIFLKTTQQVRETNIVNSSNQRPQQPPQSGMAKLPLIGGFFK